MKPYQRCFYVYIHTLFCMICVGPICVYMTYTCAIEDTHTRIRPYQDPNPTHLLTRICITLHECSFFDDSTDDCMSYISKGGSIGIGVGVKQVASQTLDTRSYAFPSVVTSYQVSNQPIGRNINSHSVTKQQLIIITETISLNIFLHFPSKSP
jgi:hypothetical protein